MNTSIGVTRNRPRVPVWTRLQPKIDFSGPTGAGSGSLTATEGAYASSDLAQEIYDLIRPRLPQPDPRDDIAADLAGRQRKIRKQRAELKLVAAANRKLKQERKGWSKVAADRDQHYATVIRQGNRIAQDAQTIVDLYHQIDGLCRALGVKPCSACKTTITTPCHECDGTGYESVNNT